jgi:hypothetical protein
MTSPMSPGAKADPPVSPRFALGCASVVYALATLCLSYPALAGRFLVSPHSDQYIAGYAFREFGAAMLRHAGHFPQWNPYLMGGVPYIGAMAGDIFYPTFLLRLALPTDVALTWSFIIHVFLCGLFTYGFLRAAGLGFEGALIGGLAYLLCGPVASLVSPGHDGKLYVSAMLPAALWLLTIGLRDGRRFAWGLLTLVIGLAVLSPHPQLLQYMLITCGFYALYVAFWSPIETRPDRSTALRRLGAALGCIILGAAIGAIQFLPVREYVPWSPRAGGAGWEHAVSYSMPPEELINTYLPQFSGILDHYWGRNVIHLHSEYLGAAALVLLGLAFLAKAPARRRFTWFWSAVLVISVLWALGGYTPFYHLIYAIVPGTKFFRAPSTMLMVVGFSTAVLAGVGADVALARQFTRRYLMGWLLGACAITVLASIGGFTNLGLSIAGPQLSAVVQANSGAVIWGAWRSFVFVALLCGALFLYLERRLKRTTVFWLLSAIVALDLWTILRLYWLFSAPASVLYATDPTIEYLKQLDQPVRVLTAALGPDAPRRDPFLDGDALMVHRIRNTLGYHGNELGRYRLLDGYANGYQIALGSPNFWSLTNTQYLLTNLDSIPLAGFRKVVGPVKNAAGSAVSLYRLPGDEPFAWVAPVIVRAPDESVLSTVLDSRFDVRTAALFDTAAAVQGVRVTRLPAPLAITTRATTYAPGRIDVQLSAPAPAGSALIVSENYYVGWTAQVDGKAAPIGRADMTLIGVPLAAGARHVALTFTDPAFEKGKLITLIALGLTLILLAGGIGLERRRHG